MQIEREIPQQSERMWRVGVLAGAAADADAQARHVAMLQDLQQRGWTRGRNMLDSAGHCRRHAYNLRWNWSRSRLTSPRPLAASVFRPLLQTTRTACRSCSESSVIRSGPVWSRFVARRGRLYDVRVQFDREKVRALALGSEVIPVNLRDSGEIERAIAAFARSCGGGQIVTASALSVVDRDLIITLAIR